MRLALANLAVWSAALWIGAAVLRSTPPDMPAAPPAAAPERGAILEIDAIPSGLVEAITDRPLLVPDRRAKAVPAARSQGPSGPPALRFLGVIGRHEAPSALVALVDGEVEIVFNGDEIAGWQVAIPDVGHLVLSRGEEARTIPLNDPFMAAESTPDAPESRSDPDANLDHDARFRAMSSHYD